MILRAEDNDSFVLGEESLVIADPEVRRYAGWLIALAGEPHPRVYTRCGSILQRMPIPSFKLRRKDLDFGITRDGYYVVSARFLEVLQSDLRVVASSPIPGQRGFHVLDHEALPVLEVDRAASGTRESVPCGSCGNPYHQLFGRTPGRPPTIRIPTFRSTPEPGRLFRSDMAFGATHGRAPALVADSSVAGPMRARALSGLHLW